MWIEKVTLRKNYSKNKRNMKAGFERLALKHTYYHM